MANKEGTYTISAQKANHTTISQTITVKKGETRSFTLDSPKPIYGALNITTTPPGVNVYIDNKYMGQTPYYTSEIIIGSHSIGLKKEDYNSITENINITKNQTTSLNKTLTNIYSAMFRSYPTGAKISVNGVNYGETPINITQTSGSYKITAEKEGYKKQSKTIKFDENLQDTYFELKEKKVYFKPKKFYFTAEAGFNPLFYNALELNYGIEISNIILELDLAYPYIDDELGIYYDEGQFRFNLGYGFNLGDRFRLSPNIGMGYGADEENESSLLSIGTKAEFALTSWLELNLSPRYVFPLEYPGNYSGFSCSINLQLRLALFSL